MPTPASQVDLLPRDRRRVRRFQIETAALLWLGENTSHTVQAFTANISTAGVYLRGPFNPPCGSAVRFEAKVPPPIGGSKGCLLRGSGWVVRCEELGATRLGCAATIETFQMLPLVQVG
jgi:hypothetical protein